MITLLPVAAAAIVLLPQLFVPRVVAESSSEAVFIASRLQEQDQQLAKHAEEAEDGPILANAHIAAAAAGDTDSSAAAATAAGGGSEDHEEEVQSAADENSEWGSSSSGAADAEVPVGNQEAAAAAGGTGVKKAKFRALQPLIALRMTGKAAAAAAAAADRIAYIATMCCQAIK
jgi:hypothetical protein